MPFDGTTLGDFGNSSNRALLIVSDDIGVRWLTRDPLAVSWVQAARDVFSKKLNMRETTVKIMAASNILSDQLLERYRDKTLVMGIEGNFLTTTPWDRRPPSSGDVRKGVVRLLPPDGKRPLMNHYTSEGVFDFSDLIEGMIRARRFFDVALMTSPRPSIYGAVDPCDSAILKRVSLRAEAYRGIEPG